ncbi:hypothetical protein LOD99_322 [Oopsacas minuta]|uniref:Inositol-1-monophosphatase n=1 Tax=Oopsacas minuta TaxID=111878 RepID=A0AAV7KAB0_9METZ|nr:hypothetical protein LOD99_322 [Oopsacas minuta]
MLKSLTTTLLCTNSLLCSIRGSNSAIYSKSLLLRHMASGGVVNTEFDEYYNFALKIAREGGKVAQTALKQTEKPTFVEKTCSSDVVTKTDVEVEKLLFDRIRKMYPAHSLIGEESVDTSETACKLTGNPTWIIDPIDGTSNFVHGFPFVAISIGLWIDKKPAIGIIYNLILDQMYSACRGKGATLNGEKIHVSGQTDLNKAFIMCEWGSQRVIEWATSNRDNMFSLATAPNQCHGLRSLGSSALNICMVASGCADAYYETGLHCWDMAAGILIIEESGGVCMDIEGGELDLMSRRLLCCSTPVLAKEIVKKTKPLSLKRDDEN